MDKETNQTESSGFIEFVKLFSTHVKEVFNHFGEKIKNKEIPSNSDFIELGRTVEEKDMIAEACESIDEQYRLMSELQKSGKESKEWLENKTDELLEGCTEEERQYIEEEIQQESQETLESETEALKEVADSLITSNNQEEKL